MDYSLLVLVGKDTIQGYDIESQEYISIDGNEQLKYAGKNDAMLFSSYVKDYYNIDRMDDINIGVLLVDVKSGIIKDIYEEFKDAAYVECISIEKILPIITLKTSTQSDTKQYYSVMNQNFLVACDLSGKVSLCETDEQQASYKLSGKDFADCWNITIFNLEIYNKLKAEYRNLKETTDLINEKLACALQSLEQCSNAQKSIEAEKKLYKDKLVALQNEYNIYKQNMDLISKRIIVYPSIAAQSLVSLFGFNISYMISDGTIVKKGDILAKDDLNQKIYAVSEGRFIHLYKNKKFSWSNDGAIGLIIDQKDNRDDALKWYSEQI